jgi:hypothetical protein
MKNPYQNSSWFNQALSLEICQRIYFVAAQLAARNVQTNGDSELLPALQELARYYGSEAFILHPAEAARIFAGVSVATYQTIRKLLCSPLRRSSYTVWLILTALAHEAKADAPSREAVWAICEYLRSEWKRENAPTIEWLEESWSIKLVQLDVQVRFAAGAQLPRLVCIVANQPERVIAFRLIRPEETELQASMIALYDTIVGQRRPDQGATGGIQWRLPHNIESAVTLPEEIMKCCQELGVGFALADQLPFLLPDLQGEWTRTFVGRTIEAERFVLIFDNYLEKRHGYGPLITRDDKGYAFRHLTGYNRDPALLLPAVRHLLPAYDTVIDADATVSYAGQRYYDNLLKYWCGQPVTLRYSLHDPAIGYIYLNGEILCQVISQEVR